MYLIVLLCDLCEIFVFYFVCFFKQKTAYEMRISDWSSDVCSSDLPDELAAYIAERRADPDWRGCNVTMPHKGAVMDLVDDPGNIRGTIGAMNTVVRQPDGSLLGTNTDAAGFYAPLAELDLAGAAVAVVGAGGAERAVPFALARAHVGKVTI